MNGKDLVGETAERVLGIVGNITKIRIIIAMCSTDLASQYFVTDWLKETIMILIIFIFILFMLS
jgi:hypothetical protein